MPQLLRVSAARAARGFTLAAQVRHPRSRGVPVRLKIMFRSGFELRADLAGLVFGAMYIHI